MVPTVQLKNVSNCTILLLAQGGNSERTSNCTFSFLDHTIDLLLDSWLQTPKIQTKRLPFTVRISQESWCKHLTPRKKTMDTGRMRSLLGHLEVPPNRGSFGSALLRNWLVPLNIIQSHYLRSCSLYWGDPLLDSAWRRPMVVLHSTIFFSGPPSTSPKYLDYDWYPVDTTTTMFGPSVLPPLVPLFIPTNNRLTSIPL